MATMKHEGVLKFVNGEGNINILYPAIGEEITQAAYDELPEEDKLSGTYWIEDGEGGSGGASIDLDPTLSVEGKAADAKAVGDAIATRCNSEGFLEVKVDGEWVATDILAYSQIAYIIEKGVITGKFGGLETYAYKPETVVSPNAYQPTLTQKNDYVEIKSVNTDSSNGGGGIVATHEIIDMEKYSKLTIDIADFNRVGSSAVARILLSSELKNDFALVSNTLIDKSGIYTVDLSSVNSKCYIFIYAWCDINETLTLNVSNIWLE